MIASLPILNQKQPIFCLCPGSAAPCGVARQCRAKIDGAADPATSSVSGPGLHHATLLPRHHAWRGTFRHAMAIGATKVLVLKKKC